MLRVGIIVQVLAVLIALASCKKEQAETTAPPAEEGAAATPEQRVEPPPAAPTEPQVVGEEVSYKSGELELKGYLAYDKAKTGPRPGVLVVHEWWGHNDYSRKRAEMLAAMGYTALAVDMYGDGKQAAHPDDAQKFMKEVMGNIDEGVARFEAGRRLLEAHATTDPSKTAAIGYCFGGGVVLHAARIGLDLDGVASFHGSLDAIARAEKGAVKAKLLVANGEADPFVKAESIEAFKKEMADADADLEFVSYAGAKHAFTNPSATEMGEKFGLPLAYDAQADEQSWAKLEGFLKRVFE